MTKSEITLVRRIAKREVNTTEKYIDNKTKSRYMIGDCTLSIENGEYGEIKVYFGSKAKNSNEYVETQLETNQVWPTPKQVREMQEERRGMYRFDDMAREAKAHDGEECEDELMEIPREIRESNDALMLLSMDYFYEKIRVNQTESIEIEEWINQVRIDLKKNIIRKQNRDINNREIYAYLHDIFGPEVINIFDIKYDEDKKETN